MAKKRLSLGKDDLLFDAVPELLSALLKRVRKAESYVWAGDPEKGVHDMRVAMKRLRETLRLYQGAFRAAPYRRHRKIIERVNDLLGAVRDRDVMLARLGAFSSGAPALLESLHAERDTTHQKLVRALDKLKRASYWRALNRFIILKKSYRPAARAEAAAAFGVTQLDTRLATMQGQWTLVRFFPTPQNLHGTRIANKKVRYAMEPFLEWLPPACSEIYEELGRLHDALGDIHDDDVLANRIAETARAPDSAAPLREAWALTERERRRHLTAFRRSAARLEELGGWDALRALIHGTSGPAARKTRSRRKIEHEFKFLLKGRPVLPATAEAQFILQGYLAVGDSEERVRMKLGDGGPTYFHTLKKGRGTTRQEHEEEIDAETFFDLWAETQGLQIEKVRYVCREGNYRWEIDRYLDRGLWVAEVELSPEQTKAPALPEWLAPFVVRDVSEDMGYRNQSLAH